MSGTEEERIPAERTRRLGEAMGQAYDTVGEARTQAEGLYNQAEQATAQYANFVRENPVFSMFAAAGIGFLIARLLGGGDR